MQIKDFLLPSQVVIDLPISDKSRLLDELARRASTVLHVAPDLISNALRKREELGSTGTGGGVGIPHARVAGINEPFGILARLSKPIDYDAIDGRPVDIVFLLLTPENTQDKQLNALACAARALRDPNALRSVRLAGNSADAYVALTAKGKY